MDKTLELNKLIDSYLELYFIKEKKYFCSIKTKLYNFVIYCYTNENYSYNDFIKESWHVNDIMNKKIFKFYKKYVKIIMPNYDTIIIQSALCSDLMYHTFLNFIEELNTIFA